MYKVSVIIPTHNRGNDIKKSIYSVINQTFRPYEIIIVSDGSTDNTKQVVSKIQEEYNNIYFYEYFPNMGANHARNYGINKSNGNIIAFLDDDDEWLENKLEKQINCFTQNQSIGLVYTGVYNIYLDDNITYISLPKHYKDIRKEILFHNIISTTSTVCVKKDVLLKVGAFDENLPALQDYDLWIRICQKYYIYGIQEPLINYYNKRKTRNQISSNTENYFKAIEYISKKYDKLLSKLSSSEICKREINNANLLMNKEMRNNNKRKAFKYAITIMKINKRLSNIVYIIMSLLPYKLILKVRALKK